MESRKFNTREATPRMVTAQAARGRQPQGRSHTPPAAQAHAEASRGTPRGASSHWRSPS